ncbi:MAG: hypothetical protein ACAH95_16805 [Fimbriimonas sp.]
MLAALIVSLALVQGPAQESFFNKLFPKPTGLNGYEDFAKAADMARRLYIGTYQGWLPPERRPEPTPESEKSKEVKEIEAALEEDRDPKEEALQKRLEALNLLQVRTEESQMGVPIIQLVKVGLQKPVSKPSVDEDLFSFASGHMRQIGGLLSDTAYVQFSQGKSSLGFDSLATGLRFADATSPFGTMELLTSSGITSRMLGGFDQNLARLSVADLQKLPALCRSLLASNRLAETYAYEEAIQVREMDSIAKDFLTPGAEDIEDPTFKALAKEIKAMTPVQKKGFAAELRRRVHERFVVVQQELRKPEAEWIPPNEDERMEDPKTPNLSAVMDFIAAMVMPPRHAIATTYVRSRTQIRLLDLHSRVLAFRWIHNRLPANLAEAGVETASTYDSLSRTAFVYEVQTDRTYRLYSKGNATTGEVELRYIRPPSSPDNDKP